MCSLAWMMLNTKSHWLFLILLLMSSFPPDTKILFAPVLLHELPLIGDLGVVQVQLLVTEIEFLRLKETAN